MTPPTKQQVSAALDLLYAVGDTLREAGEMPEGELYAILAGRMSLATFNQMMGTLVRSRLVSNTGHVLRWLGPPALGGAR